MPPLQMNDQAFIDVALEYLNALIAADQEFPDACQRAADACRVDYDKLKAAYDDQDLGVNHG